MDYRQLFLHYNIHFLFPSFVEHEPKQPEKHKLLIVIYDILFQDLLMSFALCYMKKLRYASLDYICEYKDLTSKSKITAVGMLQSIYIQ